MLDNEKSHTLLSILQLMMSGKKRN